MSPAFSSGKLKNTHEPSIQVSEKEGPYKDFKLVLDILNPWYINLTQGHCTADSYGQTFVIVLARLG